MIEIKVEGSVVSVQTTEALYCGAQNTYTCSFVFDRSWDSFLKSAVFRVNGRAITAVIDDNNSCVLPWELLVRDNIGSNIEVGVYGVSAESEILTSVWDLIGAVREGSEIGSDAREPSAGVYEQVMASVKKADDKIVSYSSEVQTLTQRAESAAAVAAADSKAAAESEKNAAAAAVMAESARDAVMEALNNLPEGDTLVINDLTTGGTSAALSAEQGRVLARRPDPNLLHNWYFANAVNQRGLAEYTTSTSNWVYAVDGWKMTNATLTKADGFWKFATSNVQSGYKRIVQLTEHTLRAGEVYTLSMLAHVNGVSVAAFRPCTSAYSAITTATGGTGIAIGATTTKPAVFIYTFTPSADVPNVGVEILVSDASNHYLDVDVYAIKLEKGDVQTLAHQNADGNWVLNEIPDYGEELTKCERYFRRITNTTTGVQPLGVSLPSSAITLTTQFHLNRKMRALPQVTPSSPDVLLYTMNSTSNAVAATNVSRSGVIDNNIVEVALTGIFTVGTPYTVCLATGGYIDFSADL